MAYYLTHFFFAIVLSRLPTGPPKADPCRGLPARSGYSNPPEGRAASHLGAVRENSADFSDLMSQNQPLAP